ncbi:TraB/GumN family protein [Vibrio cyclitrophicus]|uniref:TraB/GumN family protein n=1 Tax=Vibrio cyclitrophicus TaxID=47951 RepID=UPI000C828185|nr:TraB/GumN family protein [Vibrio cyclitrophicus]PME23331.1 polysaccharide biosynthesis protein GumN [Vibrio cyclitrophicus]PME88760.1 polysaccharide biosynthesis protein GumN [Vibrio cyclitrophicus]PMF54998.1 polysaccharide biosynthesis protein GumN [Vibrio cyclitrophicus]PMG34917.1 polysaccharide biosynthesis protein GumN [Vibrio cyclitrophicus]PMH46425.1 polysaccharide biosynthesis protein GumN [Vibrio cyclitrophicus]
MRTFLYFTLLTLAFSAKQAVAEPLYWQAKKDDLTLTILGSIHVGNESMYPLPTQITDTLKKSDGLIVETDVRKSEGVVYPTPKVTTSDVLNEEQEQMLVDITKSLDMPTQQLLNAPPWATAISIQMQQLKNLGYASAGGVDATLAYKATIQDVPVISLEPLQFQIDLISGQKDSGKEWLTTSLEQFDHIDDDTHCLIESWKAGDIAKLEQFAKLSEMPHDLEKAFLTDRNIDWANKLFANDWKLDSKGHYLLVVGTLHLIGEGNLLQLLEEIGFIVTQQSQSQQAECQFEVDAKN